MDQSQNTQTFEFTYSAREQDEVRKIREKYMPTQPDKMELLRRLDRSVTQKGTVVSIIIGVVGTLIMGLGMCCCMVFEDVWFIPGIVIGLVGIGTLALAYPVYNRITQKERDRLAPEILRLTDELMK